MRPIAWIIYSLIRFFGGVLVFLTRPVFRAIYEDGRGKLPATDSSLLMKSATELCQMIRERKVRSKEVVQVFIDRIKQVNPSLNAVVAERFHDALLEAQAVDDILDQQPLPDKYSIDNAPFLGLPFTTKEAMAITGLPNTSGLWIRRQILATKDADCIALMRQAGAIPLALTNISELCMWYESSNLVYGRSNNAYHHGRIVGGSSGGEGCIQSAAASAVGIGSDIGGSIRMPCFFNGIFGHKPSTGIISNEGQHPNAKGEAQVFLGTGPMCRYADLRPVVKVLLKKQFNDKVILSKPVNVRHLKCYYMEDDGGSMLLSSVDEEIKNCIRKAAQHFGSLGCTVQKVNISRFKTAFEIWSAMMASSGNDTFCQLLGNGEKVVYPFREMLRWMVGRSRHTLAALYLGMGEKLPFPKAVTDHRRKSCELLKQEVQSLLAEDGFLLFPTHPIPAPYHNQPLTMPLNFAYTGIINVLGLPATAVPMGLSRNGIPIGLQVIGGLYQDNMTISVAEELERAFGGWVPPFKFPGKI